MSGPHYLYHQVPKNMEGAVLYPLNQLKDRLPALYQEKVRKYDGREHVMETRIPYLDCLWNDVLHFTAVPPQEIKKAFQELGKNPEFRFYKVDPHLLEPENTVVYLYKYTYDEVSREKKFSKENFEPYNPDAIEQFSRLPQTTKDYYKHMFEQGKRPLMYVRVPHILYKGTLDISSLEIETP